MCLLNDSNDSRAAKDDEPLKLHPLQILTSPYIKTLYPCPLQSHFHFIM